MKALNVTVVIDTLAPQQWVVSTLEKLDLNQLVQLNHIILQSSVDSPIAQTNADTSVFRKIGRKLLYGYINRSLFGLEPCEPAPVPTHLQKLVLAAGENPTNKQDVLVHLGSFDADQHTLPKTTHGTWVVKHDELTDRIEQAVLARRPLLWIYLWQLQNNVLERVGSHSLPMQSYSITDVLSYGFGSLPDLIASRLNWLANGYDPAQFESEQVKPSLYPRYAFPDNYESSKMSGIEMFVRSFILLGLQTKQRVRNKIQVEQWQLGFKYQSAHAIDIELSNYQALTPTKNTIWADPHALVENNQTHVFFEELAIQENRGRIAWAVLTPDGFSSEPKTVLAEEHHLSYPFVFKHNNEFYMIPETASRRTISLYKATDFPEKWERLDDIMQDLNMADTTLFQHDGLWWLFTNGVSHVSVDERDQLLLFYSDDFLSGDWHPHPLNPVVTGIDRSRMAGQIYKKNGELFRPSQFGATRYGFGVNICQIHSLTKTEYKESLISRLAPNTHDVWLGAHSATHGNEVTIIDRLRRIRR